MAAVAWREMGWVLHETQSFTSFADIAAKATAKQAIVMAMADSAITQGLEVATGLQSHFDWRGVAAAGAGAYVGSTVGGALTKIVGDPWRVVL